MEGNRSCIKTEEGETIWLDYNANLLFMPYNIELEDYPKEALELINDYKFTIQLEIV